MAIPQAGRVQSGILMDIGRPVLFDCGSGVLNRILESGHAPMDIDTIVLTHLHLDHVADVLSLLKANWLCDRNEATLYGPVGTQAWMAGLLDVYGYMQGKLNLELIEVAPGESFTPEGCDCEITSAAGVHSVPSLGYRVEYGGRSVVYSGDTEPCPAIMKLAEDADVLIHECSFPLGFEVDCHTTPDMLAGYLERYVHPGRVYLTHLYPHMQGHESEALRYLQDRFDIEVQIATDLLVVDV